MTDVRVTRLTLEVMEGTDAKARVTRAELEAVVRNAATFGRYTRAALELVVIPSPGRYTRAQLEPVVQAAAAARITRAELETTVQADAKGRYTRSALEVTYDPSVPSVQGRYTRAAVEAALQATAAGRVSRSQLELLVSYATRGRLTRAALEVVVVDSAPPPPPAPPDYLDCRHDVEGVGVDRLIYLYRQPRIQALLRAYLAEVQALEEALCDFVQAFWLPYATGARLDILGRVVGQPRRGLGDALYRAWIGARILVNRSSGTEPQISAIVRAVLGASVRFEVRDEPPAAFCVYVLDPIDPATGVELAKLLQLGKAAGVRALLAWRRSGAAFRFALSGTAVLDSEHGFETGALSASSDGRPMEYAA